MNSSTATRSRSTDQEDQTSTGYELRQGELRGRSVGILVCAAFGLVWIASTRSALSSTVWTATLVAGIAVVSMLTIGALRLRRTAAGLRVAGSSGQEPINWRRRFTFVVAGEWVAIIAAVNIVAATGHPRWIPALVCAAVGVHFAPLGRLFKLPLYYLTAAALCLVAAATLVAGLLGAPASLSTALPGLGAALTLWATGTCLLVASSALTRGARAS